MLTKEDILSAGRKPRIKKITVPGWGGETFIKVMSGLERDDFERDVIQDRGDKREVNRDNFHAKLAVRVLCNEQGERLFENKDAKELGETSSIELIQVSEAAASLNKIGAKDIEELTKNSESGQPESSTSG